jgi:hypothetical protein
MRDFFTKHSIGIVSALVLVIAVWWLVSSFFAGRSAKTEARLGKNTTEAAIESGRDAVGTIGAQGAAERAADDLTRENSDDIQNAEGADAPVDPAVDAAGRRGLCKRAAYRERPECLQQPPAP